jgi:hypothetical protein
MNDIDVRKLAPMKEVGADISATEHEERINALLEGLDDPVDSIPSALRDRDRWMVHKADKVPVSVVTQSSANWQKPEQHSSYEKARKYCEEHDGIQGVSFVFPDDGSIVCVDLDGCIDEATGTTAEWANEIVAEIDSYTEVSPSGTGLHIFAKGEFGNWSNKSSKDHLPVSVEVFSCSKKNSTVTGNHVPGTPNDLQNRTDKVTTVFQRYCGNTPSNNSDVAVIKRAISDTDIPVSEFKKMLNVVDPDDYTTWMDVCFALKNLSLQYGDLECREMFHEYSKQSSKYSNQDCDRKWDNGSDAHGDITYKKLIHLAQEAGYELPKKQPAEKKVGIDYFTLVDLDSEDIKPIKWTVDGILPEGLAILSGAAKQGKSFLGLMLSFCIATGTKFMGKYDVRKGSVLYLALEDGKRRLKERSSSMLAGLGVSSPSNLYMAIDYPTVDRNGIQEMERFLQNHDDCSLIVIDVWTKFKSNKSKAQGTIYDHQYDELASVKKLASDYGITVLLIHHSNKGTHEDVLSSISGSTAMSASPDTTILMDRARSSAQAVLRISGRDIEWQDINMEFDSNTMLWMPSSTLAKPVKQSLQDEIIEVLNKSDKPLSIDEIHKQYETLHGEKSRDTVSKSCQRAFDRGELQKNDNSRPVRYLIPPSSISIKDGFVQQ